MAMAVNSYKDLAAVLADILPRSQDGHQDTILRVHFNKKKHDTKVMKERIVQYHLTGKLQFEESGILSVIFVRNGT